MKLKDCRGLEVSTRNPDSIERLEVAMDLTVSYFNQRHRRIPNGNRFLAIVRPLPQRLPRVSKWVGQKLADAATDDT